MERAETGEGNNGSILIFEFTPFTRENLVSYLRNIMTQSRYLQERQKNLYTQLCDLEKRKIVDGQSIDERIQIYAYGSGGSNDYDCGSSGNRYNPDTLYNRWVKIFEPYEIHRAVLISSIMKVLYNQWQLECVNQCVDQLEPSQRDVIMHIYIQKEKVRPYCQALQIGHGKYNRIKENALDTLLISCNESLSELQKNWEGIDAEAVRISDYLPHRGRNGRSMAYI